MAHTVRGRVAFQETFCGIYGNKAHVANLDRFELSVGNEAVSAAPRNAISLAKGVDAEGAARRRVFFLLGVVHDDRSCGWIINFHKLTFQDEKKLKSALSKSADRKTK
jgi:hypothetical protein